MSLRGLERQSGCTPWRAASLCGERRVLLGNAQLNASSSVATRQSLCEHGSALAAPSLVPAAVVDDFEV